MRRRKQPLLAELAEANAYLETALAEALARLATSELAVNEAILTVAACEADVIKARQVDTLRHHLADARRRLLGLDMEAHMAACCVYEAEEFLASLDPPAAA